MPPELGRIGAASQPSGVGTTYAQKPRLRGVVVARPEAGIQLGSASRS